MGNNKLFSSDVKKQHTVPRFLLSHFGHGKNNRKKQIHTYDKLNDKIYSQSVYNATTRNLFYNIKNNNIDASIETILGKIENDASTIIKKIITNKSLFNLSKEEKEMISVFVVVQQSRTFNKLKTHDDIIEKIINKLLPMGLTDNLKDELLNMNEPFEKQKSFLEQILDSMNYSQYILNKDWILYETTEESPFYISDNPITLHNENKDTFRGNLGLEVKGIQIHLPLSSTLTLAFYCPSIKKDLVQSFQQAKNNLLKQNLSAEIKKMYELLNAFESGKSLSINIDNTIFLNSLQVLFSEQYIFNNKNEFKLVKDMILKNDSLKFKGTRMAIN